jgi:hypothetical protein
MLETWSAATRSFRSPGLRRSLLTYSPAVTFVRINPTKHLVAEAFWNRFETEGFHH